MGLLLVIILYVIYRKYRKHVYLHCEYFKQKQIPYSKVKSDTGMFGEYKIYKDLRDYEKMGARFLFNCYVPNGNNKTSEIDIIMIYHSGIYVFESKNYSGWIFGNSKQYKWTQTFRSGTKEHFYNPILQNKTHINALKHYLPNVNCAYHSIIVFSNRCSFKNVDSTHEMVDIIHLRNLQKMISFIDSKMAPALSATEISEIYGILYPLTQVSDIEKYRHIYSIRNR